MKILKNNLLVISMLKRHNRVLGPGETAGLRLGDIIFGANFRPCVEGVRSLLHAVKYSLRQAKGENEEGKGKEKGEKEEKEDKEATAGAVKSITAFEPILRPVITLQCWRCHQLCSDSIPGRLFPRADDVFVQGYALFRSRVLSEWERWNFNEILLNFLRKELKIRLEDEVKMVSTLGSNPRIRVIHNEVLDLERNILRAKGLRTALCVRIVHTKFMDDAVLYVLRVEDEESGLQWNVRKRYNDFYALHKELSGLSKYLQDIPFPKKRIVHSRLSLRVIEERIVALEQFIRQAVHRLTLYSTSDAQASQSLRKVQDFLDVPMFINCLKPPALDDQRYLELMIYRRLNDFASLSCQQCIRFVDSVDLDALAQNDKSNGYLPMLELVSQALREVQQYTLQQYGQQMNQILRDRRPHMAEEKVQSFVTKCVRRQVEGAIYLPLRRAIFRIVYSFIADKAERLQKSIKILKRAPIKTFFEKGNFSELNLVKSLPLAVEAFRNLVNAFLPSDQGNMLMKAAGSVMDVISDMEALKKGETSSVHIPLTEEFHKLPSPPSPIERHSITLLNSPSQGVEMKAPSRTSLSSTSSSHIGRPKSMSSRNKSDSDLEAKVARSSSNDLLSLKTLADPAGTIFSAAEHVLVDRRDFDQDGAQSGSGLSEEEDEEDGELPTETSLNLIGDANNSNDSFRELYSILKSEGKRGAKDKQQVHKVMRDMAAATMDASNKGDQNKPSKEDNEDVSSDSGSNSVRSDSPSSDDRSSTNSSDADLADGINKSSLPLFPLSPTSATPGAGAGCSSTLDLLTGRHPTASRVGVSSDSDDDTDPDSDPVSRGLSLQLSSSITQTLLSAGAVGAGPGTSTAIRGTSMTHLEGGGDEGHPVFKPSEERVETYMSPFKSAEGGDLSTDQVRYRLLGGLHVHCTGVHSWYVMSNIFVCTILHGTIWHSMVLCGVCSCYVGCGGTIYEYGTRGSGGG